MTTQPQPGVPLVPGAARSGFAAFIRRHPMPAYYALAFLISWGMVAAIMGAGPVSMGIAVTLGPLGPAVASLLLTRFLYGRAGLRDLGIRLRRWRAGARWYAVALLTGPVVMSATAAAVSYAFPGYYAPLRTTGELISIVAAGTAVGLMVGILEELGWTGFATLHLRRRYRALSTGLLMGLMWGAWHYPMFAGSADPSGAIPAPLVVAVFLFAWLPPYRVLMVWIYDRTGSLPVAMLMHAVLSTGAFINSFMASGTGSGIAVVVPALTWGAAFWAIVAVVSSVKASRMGKARFPKNALAGE